MSVHAFADESIRSRTYIVAIATVAPEDLRRLRGLMRRMLLPGQRELHLKKESPARRRQLLDRIASAPVHAAIYTADFARHQQELARTRCLTQAVDDLVMVGAHRLVLDSREEQDEADARVIRSALGPRPAKTQMIYEHLNSVSEPLIWIADATGWAYGMGGEWRRRIAPVTSRVVQCG